MTADVQLDDKAKNERSAVLNELPDNLIRFTLMMAKTFYGKEQYIVIDYIQRNNCVKEDDLRQLLKFDQRYLRMILIQLKVDKILKERLISDEADGRPRKVSYYNINYKAMLNVVKYKIDHMRQRLEVKDKDEVHKASYRCRGCRYHYDAMDMDKIFDPLTQELRCWRCEDIVEPDDTAGPTDETRSSLARFNEQMTPFFSLIQSFDGIRLARHLIEPPIKIFENPLINAENKKVAGLGERSFNDQSTAGRFIMYQDGIMISIVEDDAASKVEHKKIVPWLQSQIPQEEIQINDQTVVQSIYVTEAKPLKIKILKANVDALLKTEFEQEAGVQDNKKDHEESTVASVDTNSEFDQVSLIKDEKCNQESIFHFGKNGLSAKNIPCQTIQKEFDF